MASTTRWGGLRPEPYDPDAIDADNDGIVQEGTAWERPAGARLLDELGRAILRGATSTSRPAGLQYQDRSGKPITYTPRAAPAAGSTRRRSPLARLGFFSLGERGRTLSQMGFADRREISLGRSNPNITDIATPARPDLPEEQQALLSSFDQMRRRVEETYGPITNAGQAHAALEQAFPNLFGDITTKDTHFEFNKERKKGPNAPLEDHEQAYVTALLDAAIDHPDTAAGFIALTNFTAISNQGLTTFSMFGSSDGTVVDRPGMVMNLHPEAGLTPGLWLQSKLKRDYSGVAIEPALKEMIKNKTITKEQARSLRAAYVATHEFGHGVHFTSIANDFDIDMADTGAVDDNYRKYIFALSGKALPPELTGPELRAAYHEWEAGLSEEQVAEMSDTFARLLDAESFDGLAQEDAENLMIDYGSVSDYAAQDPFEGFAEMFAAERFGLSHLDGSAAETMRSWTKQQSKPRAKPSKSTKPASSGLGRLGHSEIGLTGKIGEKKKVAVKRPAIVDLVAPEPKPLIPAKPVPSSEPVDDGLASRTPEEITPPTAHDLDMGVVLWREGETQVLRAELENILSGPDVEWEGIPEDRARMAALMNAVADAPLSNKPLYRGEMLWDKGRFDELVATLTPGATFTTDMRGYGTDSGTALAFAVGAPQQVLYEVEPGARALRLADAVPMSRHRDDDVLDDGASELDDEMFQTISEEDEHLALGTYEVVSAELHELRGILGNPSKQRLVVKVRQTHALAKPEGGWDAPQAPPVPEVDAKTQGIIDEALDRVGKATNRFGDLSRRAQYEKVSSELRIYEQMMADYEADDRPELVAQYRAVVAALTAERERLLAIPQREDMADAPHDPTSIPNKQDALQSWVGGGTDAIRDTIDDLLGGPDDFGSHTIKEMSYDDYLRRRTQAAAMLQEYTDAGWEQYDPLYRGESLLASLEEVTGELYPVGKEFVLPLRGFSRKQKIGDDWSSPPRSISGDVIGTGVVLQFKEGSNVKALPLYEMWDDLADWDEEADDRAEFLEGSAVEDLQREEEHLVAGTVRVAEQEILPDGRVLVTLEPVTPLEPPEGGKWR